MSAVLIRSTLLSSRFSININMSTKHEWHERTPEGEVRYITASKHLGKWRFQTCLKTDERWTLLETLPLEELKQLRVILWKKYQRKRLPYEHVLEIDAMIEEFDEDRPTDDLLDNNGNASDGD